jgi:FkbM family methyltransferase
MQSVVSVAEQGDLIYDVGMHRGEDTHFYLRKGFRVVGIEADPLLARLCRERFRQQTDCGQLTILEGAVVGRAGMALPQTVTFYRNTQRSVWGTVSADWAERNLQLGAPSERIEVPTIDFDDVLMEYGMPHYMKIDIEGADMVCVEALSRFRERPHYLSVESDKTSLANVAREIETLARLGYTDFQAVEQSAVLSQTEFPQPAREGCYVDHRFERGASGVFGAELEGNWKSKEEVLRQYRAIFWGYNLFGDSGLLARRRSKLVEWMSGYIRQAIGRKTGAAVPGWYDTHARHEKNGPG